MAGSWLVSRMDTEHVKALTSFVSQEHNSQSVASQALQGPQVLGLKGVTESVEIRNQLTDFLAQSDEFTYPGSFGWAAIRSVAFQGLPWSQTFTTGPFGCPQSCDWIANDRKRKIRAVENNLCLTGNLEIPRAASLGRRNLFKASGHRTTFICGSKNLFCQARNLRGARRLYAFWYALACQAAGQCGKLQGIFAAHQVQRLPSSFFAADVVSANLWIGSTY